MSGLDHATIDELRRGFASRGARLCCLFCDASFEPGLVYPDGDVLRTAASAVAAHVETAHGGPLAALLASGKGVHGLSDLQQLLLRLVAQGASNATIAEALGGRALSTVRNHRRQLRRRAREARVFLALTELLDEGADADSQLLPFHSALPVSDDRTLVSVDEAAALLDKYFEDAEHTVLSRIPRKEKHKLVVLRRLVERFAPGARFTEKEVNARLAEAHPDTAALRRYLVDYRFMARLPDGSAYWRVDKD